jgi:hypothetical protein
MKPQILSGKVQASFPELKKRFIDETLLEETERLLSLIL